MVGVISRYPDGIYNDRQNGFSMKLGDIPISVYESMFVGRALDNEQKHLHEAKRCAY